MANKNSVPDEQTKWFKRGHASKNEYIGWLYMNDLIDESFSYDDTYHDQYSGKTSRLAAGADNDDSHDSAILEQ